MPASSPLTSPATTTSTGLKDKTGHHYRDPKQRQVIHRERSMA
jgi:hypothetical protein